MPTIINCPNCYEETYKEQERCPKCGQSGYPFVKRDNPAKKDIILSPLQQPYRKTPSAFSLALTFSLVWCALYWAYVLVAEPFGYSISRTEIGSSILWTILPAAAIFLVVLMVKSKRVKAVYAVGAAIGTSITEATTGSVDRWAKDTQAEELESFVQSLEAMDGEELGLPVAYVANFKNTMAKNRVDLSDPAMLVLANPGIIFELSSRVTPLQRQGRSHEALPIIVWVHTLRSLTRPELRGLGRKMWGQLERGFKYTEGAAENFHAASGVSLDISGAFEFPKGLTPKPLD